MSSRPRARGRAKCTIAAGLLLVLVGCSASRAATLTASCTAPLLDDDRASCGAAPVLVAGAGDSVLVFFTVPAEGIRDSVRVLRGARVSRSWTVPAGVYTVRAWAAKERTNGTLAHGCEVSAALGAMAPPAEPGALSP